MKQFARPSRLRSCAGIATSRSPSRLVHGKSICGERMGRVRVIVRVAGPGQVGPSFTYWLPKNAKPAFKTRCKH